VSREESPKQRLERWRKEGVDVIEVVPGITKIGFDTLFPLDGVCRMPTELWLEGRGQIQRVLEQIEFKKRNGEEQELSEIIRSILREPTEDGGQDKQ
jgi:hypothetical protein